MRIIKILRPDQNLAERFLDVFGSGLAVAGQSRAGRPGFFIFAATFIQEYLEAIYFKKEEVLLKALEDYGFPHDAGPIGIMHEGYQKSHTISKILSESARKWLNGDEASRTEVIYAASEYTGIMHQHMELLKSLIHPLLEQSLTEQDEQKAAVQLNVIAFEGTSEDALDKYTKLVKTLEDEVGEWKE